MRNALLIVVVLLLAGCTSPERSTKALEDSGFTDITTGGYALFACGKDDFSATKFTATNPLGKVVSGAVCCGVWKSCTVRF